MNYTKGAKLRCTQEHAVSRADIVRGEQTELVIPVGAIVEIVMEEEDGTSERVIVSHEGRDILVPLANFAIPIVH